VGQGLGEVGQPNDVVAVLVAVGCRLGERVAQLLLRGGGAQLERTGPAGLQIQRRPRPAAGGLGLGGGGPRRGHLLRHQPAAATHQRCRGHPTGPQQEPPPTRRPGSRRPPPGRGRILSLRRGLLLAACCLPVPAHRYPPRRTPVPPSRQLFAAAGRLDWPEPEGGGGRAPIGPRRVWQPRLANPRCVGRPTVPSMSSGQTVAATALASCIRGASCGVEARARIRSVASSGRPRPAARPKACPGRPRLAGGR
jgi:hypothetical protein